jgi:hypothetical protein
LCSEATQKTAGKVLQVSGPDSLEVGKTVSVLIKVEVNDSFCVKKVEGIIIKTMGNHVQVGANLVHTGFRKDNDCGCADEKTMNTVIYFTPNVAGNYVFSTEPPSSIVDLGDTSGQRIIVH